MDALEIEMGKRDDMDDDLLDVTVSSEPGGCLSLDGVFMMEDGWIKWPNGWEEFIPWTDGMTVPQLRYHVRRIRWLRTNLPTLMNVIAFIFLFISAALLSVGYNRAITEITPVNCDMNYYMGTNFIGSDSESAATWGNLNYTEENDLGLFPQPVRAFYLEQFRVENMTDNWQWYLGTWALLPSRGAFCPITVGVNAALYDARDGQEVEEDGAVTQVGVINFCFRFTHLGNQDLKTFENIDNDNKMWYGLTTTLAEGWKGFRLDANLLVVACIFTWLSVYVAWATNFTPGFAQTIEGTFFRKDKLFSRFRGGLDSVAAAVEEDREKEHEKNAAAKEAAKAEDLARIQRGEKPKRRSTFQEFQDKVRGVRKSLLTDDDGRIGNADEMSEIYGNITKKSDGVTGDGKERYLYDDAYGTFMNKASAAHSMAIITLLVAVPLGLVACGRIFNGPFVQESAFQSMFPSCEIEVKVLNATYNGEKGMDMIMYSVVMNCIVFTWHLIMHYIFHNPAGPVKEVFQMPDLKHYKEHYTPEQRAEFRRIDRDWTREKGRRTARWVDQSDEYRDFASEHCRKVPDDNYEPPLIWKSVANTEALDQGFRQPALGFKLSTLL